ncbi:MAG: SIS domain-containing protein [Oscillospiraceae bacterium]|jgi:uncharacterized phosphosugar-binding protein
MRESKYYSEIQELISTIEETQYDSIEKAAGMFADAVKNDRIIHVFGTGHSHMMGIELFVRAGGLANVNAMLDDSITTAAGARRGGKIERLEGLAEIIWEQYQIDKDDIMLIISNSGRNSVPVEMAMKAKAEGLKLIVLTSLKHSMNCESRHKSGKKLYELADVILDNCVPAGDSLLEFNGVKSGPASTIAGCFIVNSILSEALSRLTDDGISLPVFGSQNVDGFNNDDLYSKYQSRIRHM